MIFLATNMFTLNIFKMYLSVGLLASPVIKTSSQLVEVNEGVSANELEVWLYEDEAGGKQNNSLTVQIESSNRVLIPLSLIDVVDFLGNEISATEEFNFNDGKMPSFLIPLKLKIRPVRGYYGESIVTIKVNNGEEESSHKMKIKVTDCIALAEGWGANYKIGLYPVITWQSSTTYGTGCNIKSYNVYRSQDIDDLTDESKLSKLSPINGTPLPGDKLQFIDHSLDQTAKGKVFYYYVLPVSDSGRLITFGKNSENLPVAIEI